MNQLLGVLQSGQFVQFAYLQVLDLLSTTAFMLHGVGEANPLVRWSMQVAPSPFGGLMLVKGLAMALASYCVHTSRQLLLSKINYFYAVLIAWNLICLVIQTKA